LRVQGSWFRVHGSGLRVEGAGCRLSSRRRPCLPGVGSPLESQVVQEVVQEMVQAVVQYLGLCDRAARKVDQVRDLQRWRVWVES